ncbi:hypothetical protein [Mucilaginibacter celer]|uniref:Uncharacterized protein n=1 Tax=Mucilaginibacter celer TaxID=2305508 RepID=A0A494VSD6_9SPHI|nr:hypothetical protein [Mucilaginibacter celer]AYL96971.1 hypothetical protein HYN43_017390 [Mucilaginibacter celer]
MHLSAKAKAGMASNLIRISAVLTLVDYYLVAGKPNSVYTVIAMCIALAIMLVLAMFIRAGARWPKWVLLLLLAITIIPDLIGLPSAFRQNIAAALIAILIDLMQLAALVLLFIKGKDDDREPADPGITARQVNDEQAEGV